MQHFPRWSSRVAGYRAGNGAWAWGDLTLSFSLSRGCGLKERTGRLKTSHLLPQTLWCSVCWLFETWSNLTLLGMRNGTLQFLCWFPRVFIEGLLCVSANTKPPPTALLSLLLSQGALHDLTFATCPVITPFCTPILWINLSTWECFFLLLRNPCILLARWILIHLVQGLNPLWSLLPIFSSAGYFVLQYDLWASIRMFILVFSSSWCICLALQIVSPLRAH